MTGRHLQDDEKCCRQFFEASAFPAFHEFQLKRLHLRDIDLLRGRDGAVDQFLDPSRLRAAQRHDKVRLTAAGRRHGDQHVLATESLQDIRVQMHVVLLLDRLEPRKQLGRCRHIFLQDGHDSFVEQVQVYALAQRAGQAFAGTHAYHFSNG